MPRNQTYRMAALPAAIASALLFLSSPFPASAEGPPAVPHESPGISRQGFLADLDGFLGRLSGLGVVSGAAAGEISRKFRAFEARDPETLKQPGFEYAIPSVRPITPERADGSPSGGEAPRPIHEILGTRTVGEDALPETFRRMLAPTKEDGIHFDMFVKEAYLALVKRGLFRNPDGTVDKAAVSESIRSDKALYGIVAAELDAMRRDGSGKRLAQAITAMAAYAERRNIVLAPSQVRTGLLHMQACTGAKPGSDPGLYATSCGQTMAWLGERRLADAVEVQAYAPRTGEAGSKHTLVPWDPAYAREAYGQAFATIQTNANDDFWKRHFELYLGTAEAREARLNARYAVGLLELETAVGRTMKLVLCRVQGTRCDGREISLADVQAAVDETRRIKSSLEAAASPAFKARDGYLDTMRGFEQVLARARMAGLK